MPQAKITQAGTKADNTAFGPTIGSQLDAKINSVVNLDNLNSGGELTFTWSILDQPPGTADALSSVSTQNPFFTPKKEGSYLLRLVVNQALPTEQEDRVILAVTQLKTRERMPAAGETTESDTSDGWATSMNSLLRRVDTLLSDPGILVGVNGSGVSMTRGQIVRAPGTDIIKATLPGAETVPSFTTVTAATLSTIDELLCVVEGTPTGAPGVPGVGSAEQRLMKVRYIGRISALTIAGPAPVAGAVLFVNDAGAVSSIQGTIRRRIGSAMSAGSPADVWFNGVGGADIDLPSIAEPYVTNGPSALPNAFRIDGVNAGARTAAMGPFQIHTGDVSTVTQVLRRFSSLGLAIQQWQDEAGVVLAQVTNAGLLSLANGMTVTTGVATFNTGMVVADSQTVFLGQLARIRFKEVAADNIRWEDGAGNLMWQLSTSMGAWALNYGSGPTNFPFAVQFSAFGNSSVIMENTDGVTVVDGYWRVLGIQQRILFGSLTNHPLDFMTNNLDRWRIAATGELQGWNGAAFNRAIQNVLNPVNAQDAVTKTYHDTDRGFENGCHNGNFQFWQRTNATVQSSGTAAGLSTPRAKNADRWSAVIRVDGVGTGAGTNTVGIAPFYPGNLIFAGNISRAGTVVTVLTFPQPNHDFAVGQTVYKTVDPIELAAAEAAFPDGPKVITGLVANGFTYTEAGAAVASTQKHRFTAVPGTQTAMRMKLDAIRAGGDSFGFMFLIHELDRDFCRRARGKPLTISFKWGRGGGSGGSWGAGSGICEVIASNGDGWRNYTNYNGVNFGLLSAFVGQASIPRNLGGGAISGAGQFTFVTSPVGPDITAIAVTIGREWFGNAGTGGYMDVADVIVQIGDRSNYVLPPDYPYAGGSWAGERDLMLQFYETTSPSLGWLEARPYSIVGFPYSGIFGISQQDPYPDGENYYNSGMPTGIAGHPWIIAPLVEKRVNTNILYVLDTPRFGIADIAGTTGSIYDVVAGTFKVSNIAFGGFSSRQYFIDITTADAQPRTYACVWFVDADY